MCGRYALYGPISRRREERDAIDETEWFPELVNAVNGFTPRYNFAPTQTGPVVTHDTRDGIAVRELRWGLVPYWAKDMKIGYSTINARVESVREKPAFREAFKKRRCLIPARGYYEWKGEKPPKQPYFIHEPNHELMLFAGLWETWRPTKDADPLYTYTIVTGPPGLVSGDVHDRAPVILPRALWQDWLTVDVDRASEMLAAVPEPPLTYHKVDRAVGSPKNEGAHLMQAVD